MRLWKHFWIQLGFWTGGILALLLLLELYGAFTRAHGIRGWDAVPLLLAAIPGMVATLLPLAAFAAGVAVAPLLVAEGRIPRRSLGVLCLAAATVSLVAFVLHGYVGPAAERVAYRQAFPEVEAGMPGTESHFRPQLRAAYESAVADAIQNPRPGNWGHAYNLGWIYHFQLAASLLGALMVGIGALVGVWSRSTPRSGVYLWQPWVVAFALLSYFVVVVVLGNELSQQNRVHPALTVWPILLVPLSVLFSLAWPAWIHSLGNRQKSREAPRGDA